MTPNSGARGRTRDIGLNHQAGKGSTNRSNSKKFRERFDNIDFGYVHISGFVRKGNKLVKTYGTKKSEVVIELYTGYSVPCGTLGALGVGHREGCTCKTL